MMAGRKLGDLLVITMNRSIRRAGISSRISPVLKCVLGLLASVEFLFVSDVLA